MDTIQALRVVGYKVMVIHDAHVTRVYLTSPVFNKTSLGLSYCHEGDTFNRKLGNRIALGRAVKNMMKEIYTEDKPWLMNER